MAASRTATEGPDARSDSAGRSETDEERDVDFGVLDEHQDEADVEGALGDDIDDDDELPYDLDEADGGQDDDGDQDDEDRVNGEDADAVSDSEDHEETEADLAALLNARLGTDDDDEDDEDDEEEDGGKAARRSAASSRTSVVEEDDDFKVQPRQSAEWICASCFLIVNKAAAAAESCPHCGAERSTLAAKS